MSAKYQIRSVITSPNTPAVWQLLVKQKKFFWIKSRWIPVDGYYASDKDAYRAMIRLIDYPHVENAEYFDKYGKISY